jgi:hypothetical protein
VPKAAAISIFQLGEAEDWLDRNVNVPTVNSLSLQNRWRNLTG